MAQSGPPPPPLGLRLGLNGAAAAVRLLGGNRYRLADALANAAFALQPGRRSVTIRNFRAAFPELDRRAARRRAARSFREYARTSVDFLWIHRLPRPAVVSSMRVVGVEEGFERPHQAGRAGIMVLVHHGSWDVPSALATVHGVDFTAVMADEGSPALAKLVIWARAELGVRAVPASRSPRTLLKRLRSGGWVALLADIPGDTPSVVVNFLGHPTRFSSAPGALAARTGACLVAATCIRGPAGGYLIELHPPVEVAPGTDPGSALEQVIPILEEAVRRWPEQWYPFDRGRFLDVNYD